MPRARADDLRALPRARCTSPTASRSRSTTPATCSAARSPCSTSTTKARRKRIVFTGDLGRKHMPILRDPEVVDGAHVLVTESTYGDRLHTPIDAMDDELGDAHRAHVQARRQAHHPVVRARARAGDRLRDQAPAQKQGRMPPMPVYVDSPLTVKITDVFKLHPECYDDETRALIAGNDSPFDFDGPALRRRQGGLEGASTRRTSPRSSSPRAACARRARPPPPQGGDRGPEEHGLHRRLPGAAHARAAHRRAPRSA